MPTRTQRIGVYQANDELFYAATSDQVTAHTGIDAVQRLTDADMTAKLRQQFNDDDESDRDLALENAIADFFNSITSINGQRCDMFVDYEHVTVKYDDWTLVDVSGEEVAQ